MITSAAELVAWIETNLPHLDPDRFEPWLAEPPVTGARRAVIEIRIHAPAVPDQVIRVELSAAPIPPRRS
ncbi:hypothetical protein [Nocardia sp. R7R-8]|uniref:hypothetical protein n=1 Tax=Nocardia sp. R7R-8 TaxID=3459304 RepID=UPI00403E03A8